MAIPTIEIIATAIIIPSLTLLFIIDRVKPGISSANPRESIDSVFYIVTTAIVTLIHFAICYLYATRKTTLRKKILIVVLFLGSLVVILPLRFFLHPRRWDFEFRLLFGIDVLAMVILVLNNFVPDTNHTILAVAFVTILVLLFIHSADPYRQPFSPVFTGTTSTIIYCLLCFLYVKHIPDRKWKAVALSLFICIYVTIVVFFGLYWYPDWHLYCYSVAGTDACSSLALWVWIYAPKLTVGQQVLLEQEMNPPDQYHILEMAGLPTRFTFRELETATRNFQTRIGEGGSGAVFKGLLEDGSVVAVKRIKGQPSGEVEFTTEITIIASLQHINLVRLLGFSLTSRGDRYLIYPFFENGSLDAWLFANEEKRVRLTWMLRYRIAIDVAKALAYLHHECHHRILHLDIKPANILLDGGFKALISDFGISKSIGREESSVVTRARGTIGYLPPEMLVPNAISTKSDVYSYGMVLLELVGGRRNFMSLVDRESQRRRDSYFPKIARDKMMEGKLMEVVDESMLRNGEVREEEVKIVVQVALWCIQENPALRPNTTEVVEMLEGRMPVQVPPESHMFVVNFLDADSNASNLTQARDDGEAAVASATVSISILSGR
ncbi:hypothetical protein LUZ63_009132 [Rhynchospora breviuscula]|uniref:Protein kinase domain-containing protein n=1 Tax=Rhynchospora breviuscula TaxID=2022672 RepID=A0A9Q0CF94_9POAL|nr:hypothetical protein LUZ63_009132 [Rhynchospora breviuscula]